MLWTARCGTLFAAEQYTKENFPMRLHLAFPSYAIRSFLSPRQGHAHDLCASIQQPFRNKTFKNGMSGMQTVWVECPKVKKAAKKALAIDTMAYKRLV